MNSSILFVILLVAQCFLSISGRPYQDELESSISRLNELRYPVMGKRAGPHNIDTRALNQFKNCYFSPIQCVLMERRRK